MILQQSERRYSLISPGVRTPPGINPSSIWHLSIFHSDVIEELSVSGGLMKWKQRNSGDEDEQ